MIPVRKPGRPLSSCPHQKGKPCNCNNITAAIPRNGKCGCGTAEPPAVDTSAAIKTESSMPSEAVPLSPTRTTFRIQKNATVKSHSRKQSYDISLLNRMDPSAINVISGHNPTVNGNGNMNHTSPLQSPGFISNFQPSFTSEGSLNSQIEYAQMLGRFNGTGLNAFFEDSHNTISNSPPSNSSSNEASDLGTSGASHYNSASESSNSRSHPGILLPERTSCCAKSGVASSSTNEHLKMLKTQPQDALDLMRYANSMAMRGQGISALEFSSTMNERPVMQHTPQNTAYTTYPTPYGSSFYEPLQFAQWQQMMASQPESMPTQNAYMNAHSGMAMASMPDLLSANQCGCGEDCQCLGCATHPFNAAMQEYVLSALQDEQSTSSNSSNSDGNGVLATATATATETSPSILPSPIQGASPASESGSTGVMNDYLFVSYCPGSPQLCPCGDECACVGCMIHCQPPRTPVTP